MGFVELCIGMVRCGKDFMFRLDRAGFGKAWLDMDFKFRPGKAWRDTVRYGTDYKVSRKEKHIDKARKNQSNR